MQWCGFPQADVIVPCQSLCLLVLLSGADQDNVYQNSGLMPGGAGTVATREGTGRGTGSFVESSVGKKKVPGPLRQLVMSNTAIILISF